MAIQENTTNPAEPNKVTPGQAMDALLRLCRAKDGIYPYTEFIIDEPRMRHLSSGLDTLLGVISQQYEIVFDFITQVQEEQQEAQS